MTSENMQVKNGNKLHLIELDEVLPVPCSVLTKPANDDELSIRKIMFRSFTLNN